MHSCLLLQRVGVHGIPVCCLIASHTTVVAQRKRGLSKNSELANRFSFSFYSCYSNRNEMVKLRQPENEFELEFAEWNEENQKDRTPTANKRKRDMPAPVPRPEVNTRRLKIELPNVNDKHRRDIETMNTTYTVDADSAEMFSDLETTQTMDSVLKSQKSDDETVEILEIVDKPVLAAELEVVITSKLEKETKLSSSSLPQLPSFDKLETVIGNCVRLAERCIADNTNLDSSEMFGKYIASLVRELPADKRTQIQFDILQFTSNIVAKEKKRYLKCEN